MKTINKNLKRIIFLILIVVLAISFIGFTKAASDDFSLILSATKYLASLKKTESLISNFNADIFNNPVFKSLEHSIRLPLQVGSQGKENPFLKPTPPEEILLEQFNKNL